MIEEGYGRPVADGLDVGGPPHRPRSSAARSSGTCCDLFFLTEEVKKETGVADPSVRAARRHPRRRSRRGRHGRRHRAARRRQGPARADEGHRAEGARARVRGGGGDLAGGGAQAPADAARDVARRWRSSRARSTTRASRAARSRSRPSSRSSAVKRAVLKEWEARRAATRRSSRRTPRRCRSPRSPSGAREPGARRRDALLQPGPPDAARRGHPRASARRDETVATIFALAKTLGKTPVVVQGLARDSSSTGSSRPYLSEAVRLVQEGCRIEDVDARHDGVRDAGRARSRSSTTSASTSRPRRGEVLQAAFPERHADRRARRRSPRRGASAARTARASTTTTDGKRGEPGARGLRAPCASRRADKSPLPRRGRSRRGSCCR